jgi:hypothetical protein
MSVALRDRTQVGRFNNVRPLIPRSGELKVAGPRPLTAAALSLARLHLLSRL